MIDRFFSAALTFCLLGAGTAAIGTMMIEGRGDALHASQAQVRIVQLPRVVVVGHRLAASTAVAKTGSTEPATQRVQ